MKTALTLLAVLFAVLACGCMAAAPAASPEKPAAIPNLTGTWTGPMQGYDEGTGFSNYPFLSMTMTVSEQHGRLFAGTIVFTMNGTETTSGFAGAIGRDGRTLTISEKNAGYSFGELLGPDEMELTYVHDKSPYSVAIDSFRRVA